MRRLRRTRGSVRRPLFEYLVASAAQRNDTGLLLHALPFGTEEQVMQLWPLIEDEASLEAWRALSIKHPRWAARRAGDST